MFLKVLSSQCGNDVSVSCVGNKVSFSKGTDDSVSMLSVVVVTILHPEWTSKNLNIYEGFTDF